MDEAELSARLKKAEKDVTLLTRKLERSEYQRIQTEKLMEQTVTLLEQVTEDRITEEQRKSLLVFRKFVPAEFLISLGREKLEDIQLGDSAEREMTIFFSDIRSFATLSERMTPKETFTFVNNYLDRVEPAIHAYNGFIDKTIGDAIMAIFYLPEDALKASIGMRRALNQFNEELFQKGKLPIDIGIGVHTGICMMGIVGGEKRMEGTVISDAVNVAARLESLTKRYKSSFLMSEAAFEKVPNKKNYPSRFIGKVKVAGRKQVVGVIEILDAETAKIAQLKLKTKPHLESGLKLYYEKKFSEARQEFEAALKEYPEDVPANLYFKRSETYENQGVPENWAGIDVVEKQE